MARDRWRDRLARVVLTLAILTLAAAAVQCYRLRGMLVDSLSGRDAAANLARQANARLATARPSSDVIIGGMRLQTPPSAAGGGEQQFDGWVDRLQADGWAAMPGGETVAGQLPKGTRMAVLARDDRMMAVMAMPAPDGGRSVVLGYEMDTAAVSPEWVAAPLTAEVDAPGQDIEAVPRPRQAVRAFSASLGSGAEVASYRLVEDDTLHQELVEFGKALRNDAWVAPASGATGGMTAYIRGYEVCMVYGSISQLDRQSYITVVYYGYGN